MGEASCAGELESSRFQILRKLGSGGMGVVYEAYDHDTDAVIAIKTLQQVDGDTLFRFKHEFRALADVQHPNLLRFGELHCERGQWFFTMEVVHGKSFIEYVRLDAAASDEDAATDRDSEGPTERLSLPHGDGNGNGGAAPAQPVFATRGCDESRLRGALRQLATGLHALHRSGRVHRDVKPSNVLVREDGHLVLLDFGLVDEIGGGSGDSGAGLIVGTPSFMAPEQGVAPKVGPEADWYSVGVMLFLALTGRLPFRGAPDLIVETKRRHAAPAPSEVRRDVPPDLDQLCRELCARDPAARPTGEALLRRLGADDPACSPSVRLPTALEDTRAFFVGRHAELSELTAAFAGARAGRSELTVVQGDPGVGKSALVRAFLEREARRDPSLVILSGRCYEQETVPFKAFDSVIDALTLHLASLGDGDAAALLDGGVRFLASVFPVLKRVPAVAARVPAERAVHNAQSLRDQAFRELKQLLSAIAERVPLVVFIDDLQWADQDSIALLGSLLAEPAPRGLFVATSRQTSQARTASGLAPELAALPFRHVALHGLPRDAARALWDALWSIAGVDRASTAPDPGPLLDEAAGHPLFLSELVRHTRTTPTALRGHAHLQDVLRQRFLDLDEPARRFMEMVALAGAPIHYQVVARAAELDVGDCAHLIGQLRSGQLIRMSRRGDDRLVEPYHDRIRESILLHLREGESASVRMQRLHLRLGRRLLEHTSDDELPSTVFTVVHHLNAAAGVIDTRAERRRLAELNLMAGGQAQLATAYAMALDYCERGLLLLDDDRWQSEYELTRALAWQRMEAAYLMGQRPQALRHFAELLPCLASDEERAELYIAKMTLDTRAGLMVDAIVSGREALGRFGVCLPRRAGKAAVLREYAAVRWAQGRRTIAELVDLPELTDRDKRCVVRLLVALAPPAFFVSTELMTVCLLRLTRLSLRHGVIDASAYGLAGYGVILSGAFGKHEEGHAFGQLSLRLQERFANRGFESKLCFLNGSYLTAWVRPFAEANELLRRGCEAGLASGDTIYESFSAGVLAVLAWCAADPLPAFQAQADASRAVAERRRDADTAGMSNAYARYCMALRGLNGERARLSSAESDDASFRASLSDERTPMAMFTYAFMSAQLAYLDGDVARAQEMLRETERRIAVIFGVPTNVELHLWRVILTAAGYAEASPPARIAAAWRVRRSVGKLARWGRLCPQNFAAHHRLAVAVQAHMLGRKDAPARCDEAVATARQHGNRKWEAVALELLARLSRQRGDEARAEACRREAIDAYTAWGAAAKAQQLQSER